MVSQAKRQADASVGTASSDAVVPMKQPRLDALPRGVALAPSQGVDPGLPATAEERKAVRTVQFMEQITCVVRQRLPEAVRSDPKLALQFKCDLLWQEAPLDVVETSSDAMMGYKAAWTKTKCMLAVNEKLRYEGGANIDWLLGTFTLGSDEALVGGDVCTFDEIETVRVKDFLLSDEALASSQGGRVAQEHRRIFPVELATTAVDPKDLEKDRFEHSLLLLDRHVYFWAWWLHMYKLLKQSESDHRVAAIAHHLEMGLGVTLHVRVRMDVAAKALWSSQRSETVIMQDSSRKHETRTDIVSCSNAGMHAQTHARTGGQTQEGWTDTHTHTVARPQAHACILAPTHTHETMRDAHARTCTHARSHTLATCPGNMPSIAAGRHPTRHATLASPQGATLRDRPCMAVRISA
jgi:hypothetical protein